MRGRFRGSGTGDLCGLVDHLVQTNTVRCRSNWYTVKLRLSWSLYTKIVFPTEFVSKEFRDLEEILGSAV